MTACFLLALLALAPHDTANSEFKMIVRSYDLSQLGGSHARFETAMEVVPYQRGSGLSLEQNESEYTTLFEPDRLMELIHDQIEPELWEWSLSSLRSVGNSTLLLRAPESVHTRVESLIRWLHESMVSTRRLQVRVYRTDRTLAGAAVVSAAAAARRRGDGAELMYEGSTALTSQTINAIHSVERQTVIFDWDAEIAQGSAIADPVTAIVETGLKVLARGAPVPGGTYLDLIMKVSDPGGPSKERYLATQSILNNKSTLQLLDTIGLVEHPPVDFATLATSAVIPEGKLLSLAMSVKTTSRDVHYLMEIEPANSGLPFHARHTLAANILVVTDEGIEEASELIRDEDEDEEEYEEEEYVRPMNLEIIHSLALTGYGLDIRRVGLDLYALESWREDDEYSPFVAAFDNEGGRRMELDTFVDMMREAIPECDESDRIMLDIINNGAILIVPPEISERIRPYVESLVQPGPSYVIEGGIENSDGVSIGSFQVPALLGRAVGVWSGHQTSRISDWDVDVANESAIPHPEVRALIDGYGLRLELNQSPHGTLQLDVSAKLQFLVAPPRVQDLGTIDRRIWDQVRCRTRSIEDLRYLPALGGEIRFEDSRLTLVLKVTPQQAQ